MSFEHGGETESREFSSRIELSFFRHDAKEKAEGRPDVEVGLLPEGKAHAKSLASLADLRHAVAFGSPRRRTQETSALRMAGARDDVTGQETLSELRQKIDRDTRLGSKLRIDPRLDIHDDLSTRAGGKLFRAFSSGTYLSYLVAQSDRVAQEEGDAEAATYARLARGIAQIVEKYLAVAPRFDRLVQDPDRAYPASMQRFFGTHQGVAECFLLMLVEKTRGPVERDRLIRLLGDQGFGFSEGFKIELLTVPSGSEPVVRIAYHKTDHRSGEQFDFEGAIPRRLIADIALGDV